MAMINEHECKFVLEAFMLWSKYGKKNIYNCPKYNALNNIHQNLWKNIKVKQIVFLNYCGLKYHCALRLFGHMFLRIKAFIFLQGVSYQSSFFLANKALLSNVYQCGARGLHCVAKVYAVLPFYDVKCLCSGGLEWGRKESHSH